MLFGNDNTEYWIASLYVNVDSYFAYFGLRSVLRGSVKGLYFLYSDGDGDFDDCGVRAVVTLSSNIKLDGTADSGYEII